MNIKKNLGTTCPFSLVIFDLWETGLTLYMLDMLNLVAYLRVHECFIKYLALKLSRNRKDLNQVTAAPFSVSFSQLPAPKKTPPKTGQL